MESGICPIAKSTMNELLATNPTNPNPNPRRSPSHTNLTNPTNPNLTLTLTLHKSAECTRLLFLKMVDWVTWFESKLQFRALDS